MTAKLRKGRCFMSLWVVVFFMISVVYGHKRADGAETLKIGVLAPLSGPVGLIGMIWVRGFELGVDYVNEHGGVTIDGRAYQLKLQAADTQGSADEARSAALKLIHNDKVDLIIGGFLEPAKEAINRVTEQAKMLLIAPNANIPGHPADVSPKHRFQVRLGVSHDLTHPVDIQFLQKNYPEAKRIAVSAPDFGYDPMIADLQKHAQKHGLEIVYTEKWQWGTTDFIPVMTKVLTSKPDVIFAMVSGQAQYQLQAARQLGFKGPFVSNAPLAAEVFLEVAGRDFCDKLIVNAINTVQTPGKIAEIIDRWNRKYKDPFISDAVPAFDVIWVTAQVLNKANSLDALKVIATFESMVGYGDLITAHGAGKMGEKERFGVNRVLVRPIPVTHVLKGQIASFDLVRPE